MREKAGDKNSSLMVSMFDVHDKLVEDEEMLVSAAQGREDYSLPVAVWEMVVLAPLQLQGMEVEMEQGDDFGLLVLRIARCPRN